MLIFNVRKKNDKGEVSNLTTDNMRCICNNPTTCKGISNGFKALFDLRGLYGALPKLPGKDQKITPAHLYRTKWVERTKLALNADPEDVTVDNRDFKKDKKKSKTRAQKKAAKRSRVWIALWHYDPTLLKLWFIPEEKRLKNPRTDSVSVEHVNSQMGGDFASGLTNQDKKDDGHYFILPKYNPDHAKKDLVNLQSYAEGISQAKLVTGTTPASAASVTVPTPDRRVVIQRRVVPGLTTPVSSAPVISSSRVARNPNRMVAPAPRATIFPDSVISGSCSATGSRKRPPPKKRPTVIKRTRTNLDPNAGIKHMNNIAEGHQKKTAAMKRLSLSPADEEARVRDNIYEYLTGKHAGYNRLSVQSKKYFR